MWFVRSVAVAALLGLVLASPAEAAGGARAKAVRGQQAHVNVAPAKSQSAAELVAYYHHRQLEPKTEAPVLRLPLARLRQR